MNVILSHPTGNANVRAVLQGLDKESLIHSFHTTLAFPNHILTERLFGKAIQRQFERRCFKEVSWTKVRMYPFREAVRLTANRLGMRILIKHEIGWASVDAVYTALDSSVAKYIRQNPTSIRAVYAYEDAALETFCTAKKLGITCLYDLPIAYWRTLRMLLEEEAARLPEWAPTMKGLIDSKAKLNRKDEEIIKSDRIFVASTFTRTSLTKHFGNALNISTISYGCPVPIVLQPSERSVSTPIHLFFAGQLTQRKGFADLIAATNLLQVDWRLTIAGSYPSEAPKALDRFLSDPRCHWLGVLPHHTLLRAMTLAHVFVLPSIVEGFGMVITEALAAGLPVITTPNTAGPDILTDGHDGFIVPIRSPELIADRITVLANDESLRFKMALNALQRAANLSWDAYRTRVVDQIRDALLI